LPILRVVLAKHFPIPAQAILADPTKGAAIRALASPPLAVLSLAGLRGQLAWRGFVKHRVLERGQEIWWHADHSLVRIKLTPEAAGGRPIPHFAKEVTYAPAKWNQEDVAMKLTDSGIPTLPGSGPETIDPLRGFLNQKASGLSTDAATREHQIVVLLERFLVYWGNRTHIDLL
jgi:hypothetical protein